VDGALLHLSLDGLPVTLPLQVRDDLPVGLVGLPVGLPGIPPFSAASTVSALQEVAP
jgi:NADH-quinone oxidoreductase subunit G